MSACCRAALSVVPIIPVAGTMPITISALASAAIRMHVIPASSESTQSLVPDRQHVAGDGSEQYADEQLHELGTTPYRYRAESQGARRAASH